jgi:putative hemolysin
MKENKLIDIRKVIGDKNPKLLKLLPGFVIRYIQRILHEKEVNEVVETNKDKHNQDFCQAVIDRFNIKLIIEGIENVPSNGGVTLAMNHPLGGMDAMALVTALKNQRTDLKFIVNDILLHLESMKGMFVGVNKHGRNSNSNLLKIDEIFSTGSAVCIFPAGLVSRKMDGKVQDLAWTKTFVSLSLKHNQPIIPVYIDGKLSNFFYRLAAFRKAIGIKANIEMFFLVDELFKQKDVTMKLTFGKPIYPDSLDKSKSQKQWAEEIRNQVYSFSEK